MQSSGEPCGPPLDCPFGVGCGSADFVAADVDLYLRRLVSLDHGAGFRAELDRRRIDWIVEFPADGAGLRVRGPVDVLAISFVGNTIFLIGSSLF